MALGVVLDGVFVGEIVCWMWVGWLFGVFFCFGAVFRVFLVA